MATYSEEEKARILSYPIEDLLSVLGKRTDHRRDMYFSPFRDETQPSLHISRSRNLWKDFGDNTGGNVLTMASRLLGISTARAWDYIAGLSQNFVASGPVIGAARRSPEPRHRIIIDSVSERFIRRQIVEYAKTRGIPLDLLSRYCSEVTYHIEGSQGLHCTAIGFPTDGGWVLRRPAEGRDAKRSTSGRPSFLGPNGRPVSSASHSQIQVFEGFFDFLSWLVLGGRTLPSCDVCVLNSTGNLGRAMDFISAHEEVHCWMDDDRAGRDAYGLVKEKVPQAVDHLADLLGHNDLNDLLRSPDRPIVQNNSIQPNLFIHS